MWNREDVNAVPSTFVPLARLNGKYAPAFGTFEDAAAGHVNMTTSPAVSTLCYSPALYNSKSFLIDMHVHARAYLQIHLYMYIYLKVHDAYIWFYGMMFY